LAIDANLFWLFETMHRRWSPLAHGL
jgi:hypothetical protein